jgi:hypothetical protein
MQSPRVMFLDHEHVIDTVRQGFPGRHRLRVRFGSRFRRYSPRSATNAAYPDSRVLTRGRTRIRPLPTVSHSRSGSTGWRRRTRRWRRQSRSWRVPRPQPGLAARQPQLAGLLIPGMLGDRPAVLAKAAAAGRSDEDSPALPCPHEPRPVRKYGVIAHGRVHGASLDADQSIEVLFNNSIDSPTRRDLFARRVLAGECMRMRPPATHSRLRT